MVQFKFLQNTFIQCWTLKLYKVNFMANVMQTYRLKKYGCPNGHIKLKKKHVKSLRQAKYFVCWLLIKHCSQPPQPWQNPCRGHLNLLHSKVKRMTRVFGDYPSIFCCNIYCVKFYDSTVLHENTWISAKNFTLLFIFQEQRIAFLPSRPMIFEGFFTCFSRWSSMHTCFLNHVKRQILSTLLFT